jgi:hypothetical protein
VAKGGIWWVECGKEVANGQMATGQEAARSADDVHESIRKSSGGESFRLDNSNENAIVVRAVHP